MKTKYQIWTEKKIDEFFEDNAIELDWLQNGLINMDAKLEMDTDCGKDKDGEWTELTIKIKLREV